VNHASAFRFARRLLAAALAVCLLAPGRVSAADDGVLAAQSRRIETIARAAPAVVAIFSKDGDGGGSGVLISADGYAVTNHHVVEGQGPFLKCGLNDGRLYDAVLVGVDPTGDVALIQLLGRDDFPKAVIGDSDRVQVGDWTYAMGNPFLLATDLQPTVTYGLVSGVHRYQYPAGTFLEYTDCIQVDTSINPGNSGGPLFNNAGELIGINGRISVNQRGRINVGAGYAISIQQVLNFLDHLKSGRIVDHATLGATVRGGDDGAVYVSSILEQSEAFRRGLRVGDEVVSFAGRSIRSVNQFKNILGIYPKGWTVPLVYRRDGEKQTLAVRLRALHRAAELLGGEEGDQPRRPPEGPDPDQRRPNPDPQPPRPRPLPPEDDFHSEKAKSAAAPPEHAHLFVQKAGYANWHFNVVERDRVLTGLRRLGDFSRLTGAWELTGKTDDGVAVTFKLNEQAVAAILGDLPAVQPLDQPFVDQPPGSGGLLTALAHWRWLLLDPDARFTEFYYLGSEPLDGVGERVDVLIATKGTTTSRWYFSRNDGRLLGWDTGLEEDVDECQVRIATFATRGAVQVPEQLVIRHAGAEFAAITLEKAELRAP